MAHRTSPILNDEERELLDAAPEECLRHIVQRGALPLDQVTDDLPPRVAAAVRSIAIGERLAALPRVAAAVRSIATSERLAALDVEPEPEGDITDWGLRVREMLPIHPQLMRMLDEEILTPGETMDAAHAIDHALGRYLTGTRYAAP